MNFTSNFDVVTIGGAVRDMTFFTNKGRIFKLSNDVVAQKLIGFEYGSKVKVDQVNCTFGGGAFNAACTFKKMDLRVSSIVRVGNDQDGLIIKNHFNVLGIDEKYIETDNNKKTGFSFILNNCKKECDNVVFTFRGANENLEISEKTLDGLHAKWFYISSLSGNFWQKGLKNILNYAKKINARIAWNPGVIQIQGGKGMLEKFLKMTDILVLNKHEAIELVLSGIKIGKRNPNFLNKPLYLLNVLSDWGPKTVIITAGRKGAYALNNGKYYHEKAILRKVVDTTGVGDAFASAFISGLIYEKNNILMAMKWGIQNSSNVLTKSGAQEGILTKEEMLKKIEKYR